ncbi:zinc-binding dehydrogenase [Paenibacillus woosongensis]|uniref:Zinc-binding dehydrogenase n=1 Tax=Paenibacillus woosongensis TaxID=307580 RepID=A0AA95IBN6_9BACL|nr:zinc-binding dehydrogenase [Paenibacillus woosongensis]WHX50207.1 zinc-binding dehydrogenase [Paenibacillus woosongensis]
MRINRESTRTSVFQECWICCLTVPYYIGKSIGISLYCRKVEVHRTSGGLFSQSIDVGPGDILFINGAAESLGAFAVQLAKEWGAKTVIGTASKLNHDYLRSLGAVPLTYEEGLAERVRAIAPDGVDAAFDTAGGEGLRAAVDLVEDKKRICTFFAHDLIEELGLRVVRGERSAARLAELVELHSKGKLHIHIRQTFPLDQIGDAHRVIETRRGRGKIVLTLD